ncbi:MAG: hypothetical protein ACREQO_20780 [Candidatus Binatia bacterium]
MVNNSDDISAELATVDAVLACAGSTRRVDALALMWIKVEKQLRKLFCYLLYRNPAVSDANLEEYVRVLAEERRLSPGAFIKCFDALSTTSLRDIVGLDYDANWREIKRIRRYRNTLLHGKISGQKITSRQLERDIVFLRRWVESVAKSCDQVIGYNGIGRNTFRKAKEKQKITTQSPYGSATDFKRWLSRQVTG